MKKTLEYLVKIKTAVGYDKCNVLFSTNRDGDFIIDVHWFDTGNLSVEKIFSPTEIDSFASDEVLIDYFIAWVKKMKVDFLKEHTKNLGCL